MKRKIMMAVVGCMISIGLGACQEKEDTTVQVAEEVQQMPETEEIENLFWDHKEIHIPGLSKQYKIIVVNDQHIIIQDGDYTDEKSEEVKQRATSLFVDSNGKTSSETWTETVDAIKGVTKGVRCNKNFIKTFRNDGM